MADPRRFTAINYGQAGAITYVPRADPSEGPGLLHTTRIASSVPCFQLIGSVAELYAPSRIGPSEPTSGLWEERRMQGRWLLKSYPEASIGYASYEGVLSENMSHYRKAEDLTSPKPLLAIGPITDLSYPSKPRSAQVLAAATGETGQLLRLVNMDESQWQWGNEKSAVLDLSIIDNKDLDDEVVWGNDGLPISQIKFATTFSPHGRAHWLIVQKETSTTLLRPEYRQTPTIGKISGAGPISQRPSRIDPVPVLSISHQQTGGNAHCDVTFIPSFRDQAPQLAIIDECGYWTIWDIEGTLRTAKNNVHATLSKTGHMLEGLLNKIPAKSVYKAEPYGILFAGAQSASTAKAKKSTKPSRTAGRYLLMWCEERFRAFDLELSMLLPKIPNFLTRGGRSDGILDVQPSPVNSNHIFVLTRASIFWVSIANTDARPRMLGKPSVLVSCAHPRAGDRDLRMTVCQADKDDSETLLAFVHSPSSTRVAVYWFSLKSATKLPLWHRYITELPLGETSPSQSGAHTLVFQPAQLKVSSSLPTATSPGSILRQEGTRFLQGTLLTPDLGVCYCMCSTFTTPAAEVSLPSKQTKESRISHKQEFKRQRKWILKQMTEAFVVPDGGADIGVGNSLQARSTMEVESRNISGARFDRPQQPLVVNFNRLFATLQKNIEFVVANGQSGLPRALISLLRETIQQGTAEGRLPLLTWRRIVSASDDVDGFEEPDIDTNEALESLQVESTPFATLLRLERYTEHQREVLLTRLHDISQEYTKLWLDPILPRVSEDLQRIGRVWVAELARDSLLSSCGVVVQDTPLFGDEDLPITEESTQQSQLYSSRIHSSQTLASSIPSSPPVGPSATADPDGAFQRLQLLAPTLRPGALGTAKPSSVLSYWPTERGVDTADYVSSVAVASDKRFDEARQRLQKIQARRKTQAEKYGSKMIRTGRPEQASGPAQILSSQQQVPGSSQSQPFFGPSVTMSQPVSGAFGDRKKVKKAKRKSGFR